MEEALKTRLAEAGVDMKVTLGRFLNNEALYEKFLLRLKEDSNMPGLEKALTEQNMQDAERYAHTLKGVTANLGLEPLASLLADMVKQIRSGQYEHLNEECVSLREQYDHFCRIIEQKG